MDRQRRTRVGAVNYLNTKPLIHGLADSAPWIDLSLDLPSRLADDLAAERLDAALIPSIEFFQQADYRIVSDACIACRGPVLSVKVFFRRPIDEVRSLALDEGSRTSAALTQILLAERHGVRPRLETLPIGATFADTSADAVLLIGDRAIHSPGGSFVDVWDLGDEWRRWAGLPFVFAMWVGRSDADLSGVGDSLNRARDEGVARLDEIAAREAAPLGLSRPECLSYLRDNLHFQLGERELQGLDLYYKLAVQLELAPPGATLGFHDCQNA